MTASSSTEADAAAERSQGRGALAATAWMIGAVLAFSLMAIAGRELAGDANTFQIMFWRSVVGFTIVAVAVAASSKGFAQLRTRRPGLHTARNFAHFFGQNCWFYAVATIPLAQVFALEFTTPIWVALLAPLALGEHLTRWRLIAAVLGFLGVLIVARPGLAPIELGHWIALAAALGFTGNVLSTKALSNTETPLTILFWMTASQAVMALVCDVIASGWAGALPAPDAREAFWFAIIGMCGLGAHYCMTNAFRHADASIVSPMEFARLPMIAVVAALLYGEALDPWVFLGGLVILSGNLLNIRMDRARRARDPASGARA